MNGRGGVRADRDPLPAAEGHAADDVVAVEPAMLEGGRDMAGGDRQHAVGEPHVHLGGQILERLPGLGEDPGQPDPEPLHGVAAEIGLRPAGGDHHGGQRVERGMAEMRGRALQSPDGVGQRRRTVDQADRDAQHEQREQRHPDRDVEVEQELLQRGIFRDQRGHRVAAAPHEDEAHGHDPVNQARGQVVLLIGHRRGSFLWGRILREFPGACRRRAADLQGPAARIRDGRHRGSGSAVGAPPPAVSLFAGQRGAPGHPGRGPARSGPRPGCRRDGPSRRPCRRRRASHPASRGRRRRRGPAVRRCRRAGGRIRRG